MLMDISAGDGRWQTCTQTERADDGRRYIIVKNINCHKMAFRPILVIFPDDIENRDTE